MCGGVEDFYLYLLSKRYFLSLFLKAAYGRDGDGKDHNKKAEGVENLVNDNKGDNNRSAV